MWLVTSDEAGDDPNGRLSEDYQQNIYAQHFHMATILRLFSPVLSRPKSTAIFPSSTPRTFTTLRSCLSKNLPPRPKPPPDSEIEEAYLKGSGPGGQKINKTNSAVQLKHIPTGIVVKSQATRSRSQNRKIARSILAEKVDDLINGDKSRSAIVGDIKKRKADSATKKSRRKYRNLQENEVADEPENAPEMKESNNSHQQIVEETTSCNKGTNTQDRQSPGNTGP